MRDRSLLAMGKVIRASRERAGVTPQNAARALLCRMADLFQWEEGSAIPCEGHLNRLVALIENGWDASRLPKSIEQRVQH